MKKKWTYVVLPFWFHTKVKTMWYAYIWCYIILVTYVFRLVQASLPILLIPGITSSSSRVMHDVTWPIDPRTAWISIYGVFRACSSHTWFFFFQKSKILKEKKSPKKLFFYIYIYFWRRNIFSKFWIFGEKKIMCGCCGPWIHHV